MLSGQVAMVTGAGCSPNELGVGAATAMALAEAGARIVVVDLDQARVETTVASLSGQGCDALAVVADIADESTCRQAVQLALEHYGRIDVLINNAATARGGAQAVHEVALEDWRRVLDVNLTGAMLMTKHVLDRFMEQMTGVVVNIASVSGVLSLGTPAYSASKAALIALTRDTAVLYGRHGVRANALAVGHIESTMQDTTGRDMTARRRRRLAGPLGVEGTPRDVARAALFLSGPDSRLITGQCIAIDAGTTAMAPLVATGPLMQTDGPPAAFDLRTLGLR